MSIIDITIVRRSDPPPWRGEIRADQVVHLREETVWRLAGLDAGTTGGAPSVALRLDLPEGAEVGLPSGAAVVAETTLAAWIAATCALRGAFPEAFVGTPLAVLE